MGEYEPDGELEPHDRQISDEELASFVALGQRLSAQMAAENFQVITAVPGWTVAHVDAAMETALERISISARDALSSGGGDPHGAQWQCLWTAMETSYRETIAALLKASARRGGGTLQ